MRIVFIGTGEIGVPTLRALLDSEHEVVAVVTQPDKRVGREQRIQCRHADFARADKDDSHPCVARSAQRGGATGTPRAHPLRQHLLASRNFTAAY